MKLLRVPVEGLRAGVIELAPEQARYVRKVHRLAVGDELTAFDPEQGVECSARVARVSKNKVTIEAESLVRSRRLPRRQLWLLVGMTKSDAFDLVVREATALGVTCLVPVLTEYAQRFRGQRLDGRVDRWRRIAVQGARQSERGDVPRIMKPRPLQDALQAVPAEMLARFCAWERAERSKRLMDRVEAAEMTGGGAAWLVGPEGGLTQPEVDAAQRAGFKLVYLAPFVLRTETAVVAALGAWQSLMT